MAKLKNISSLGDVDVPLLGRIVTAGEEFNVPAATAKRLLEQPDNFRTVTPATKPATRKPATTKGPSA